MPIHIGAPPAVDGVLAARAVEVVRAELQFLDPPETGAHAVLAVTMRNLSDAQSPAVVLSVPADWFERFAIVGAPAPCSARRLP